jgi:hypothetical protein
MKKIIAAALLAASPALAQSTSASNPADNTVSGSATADSKFRNPNDEQADKLAGARPAGPTPQERAQNNATPNGNASLNRGSAKQTRPGAVHALPPAAAGQAEQGKEPPSD